MDRPSKEQVDNILRAHRDEANCNPDSVICMLVAEVRALREELEYRAEVDKLRGDEQDAWARLGAELCEAETERDSLRAEVDQLRALKMLVLAYKRDFEVNHTDAIASRYELFEAL